MTFKDLDIKNSYISMGDNGFAESFLVPALKQAKLYRRSVGFFSSSAFEYLKDGLVDLIRNGGKVQLIASPELNEDDIEAINLGYLERNKKISDKFSNEFMEELEKMSNENLELLSEMIAKGDFDIQIAVTHTNGMYHDKLGILDDDFGNIVVFYGSANESKNGLKNNYEKIRIVKSWNPGQIDSVLEEVREFDALWNKDNKFVEVMDYTESAKKDILKVREKKENAIKVKDPNDILRDYQKEAIQAWISNRYTGFMVMATGTGKTWTALYAAKRLLEKHPSIIVITAPYRHLVRQWYEDVKNIFPGSSIVMALGDNPTWEADLKKEVLKIKHGIKKQLIVISTIVSFRMTKFENTLNKIESDRLLIVDEAHRFTARDEWLHEKYKYMLGLSATPFSGTSSQSGLELMNFFGGQVYNLPIEKALEKKCLVNYYYRPIFVYATADEEERFKTQTAIIASCFKGNVCIDKDKLIRAKRNRLRIISMAEEKQNHLENIISNLNEKDHLIVYCGDGKLFDENTGEEIRHINSVKRCLNNIGYKASQFTAKENIYERMELVDAFNKGGITALAAIRCLDEGINIPSIKAALILSSNDDYREFVQRRGRILRKHDTKTSATIYDVIVLPSTSLQGWAKIELRRFNEYAKLALNKKELDTILEGQLTDYNLSIEDINVFEYEEEGELDE